MKKLFFGAGLADWRGSLRQTALLEESGKIIALGGRAALKERFAPQRETDLGGGTLIPAFIDSHSHFTETAFTRLQADFTGAGDIEELRRRVRGFEKASSPAPEAAVTAFGYDENNFKEKRYLSQKELDYISPSRPLIVRHSSGHIGFANTAAQKAFGIKNAKDGVLFETEFFEMLRRLPPPGEQSIRAALVAAQRDYLRRGVCTAQDGAASAQLLGVYKMLVREKLLRLRLAAYFEPQSYEKAAREMPQAVGRYDSNFKIAGIKIFLDGSPQAKTAWMLEPYIGGGFGVQTMSDSQVEDAMELSVRNKTQLIAHCNGDAAAQQFLRCAEKVAGRYPEFCSLRPVIIHAQFITEEQVARAARLGVLLSFFSSHSYYWGDVHIKNLGFQRASRLSPAGWALKYGVPFTLHCDSPVLPPDMLDIMRRAVLRQTKSGIILGAEHRLSPKGALEALTRSGAYQYFEENERGGLSEGMAADLVLLSANPLAVPPQELGSIKILAVFNEGGLVYKAE